MSAVFTDEKLAAVNAYLERRADRPLCGTAVRVRMVSPWPAGHVA
jgi:hypothetical protein